MPYQSQYNPTARPEGNPLEAMYFEQLQRLQTNPSSITTLPGYRAGMEGVQRSLAAQGFQGSGNMMAALSEYGGDFYLKQMEQLGKLYGDERAGNLAEEQLWQQGDISARELDMRGASSYEENERRKEEQRLREQGQLLDTQYKQAGLQQQQTQQDTYMQMMQQFSGSGYGGGSSWGSMPAFHSNGFSEGF